MEIGCHVLVSEAISAVRRRRAGIGTGLREEVLGSYAVIYMLWHGSKYLRDA